MKNYILAYFSVLGILCFQPAKAQVPNANSFSSQVNYTGYYRYGVNPGYYPGWSAENTAVIAAGSSSVNVKGVGVKSYRVPLYEDFLTTWGLTVELGKFQTYASLGMDDHAVFVGSPDAAHRDPTTYPGSPEQSKTFKNLYEPIWLDAAQTQINPNNYYAKYLYDIVKTYGAYVKFWEVMNEPDFTYSSAGWMGDQNPRLAGSWYDHNPNPDELVNLRAPIFTYIRMLRISWEVIKKLQPDDFVCIGGIGYSGFLDAILRNTDNPSDGSVNASFPVKGGAYFDVVSFHSYPMYNVKVGTRHSDAAAASYIATKNVMDNLVASYGYNGSQYPRKQFICTETGLPRAMTGSDWGSNEAQRNYIIKASVLSQKNSIRQVYWFALSDGADANNTHDKMGLYNYLGGSSPYRQTATDQGKALKTSSDLLYGKTYDAARTSALNLPSSVEGAAFRAADGTYTYVLWAKTTTDISETANASYSFPNTVIASANVLRKEWNFSETNSSTAISKTNIALAGSPSFFSETSGGTTGNQPPVANAGQDQAVTLPANTANLQGTGSDADGMVMAYAWSQISGPSSAGILSPNQSNTLLSNLVQGVYQFELKATDNLGAVGKDTVQVTVNAAGTSAGSAAIRIEAESYSNMNGVVKENTSDAGGGQNVGYIDNGDWMDYAVTVAAAGTYPVNLRIASPNAGQQLQIKNSAGSVLATVNILNTGGYQNWQTVSATINLAAGTQTIRIYSASNGWNFNWWEIGGSAGSSAPSTGSSSRMEAENYTNMYGVQKENASDVGGGQNVGYIDNGDWMDYSVNVTSAGTYSVNLRVASPSGGQLQIKNSAGTVLATVTIPNTGGYQNWQTVTATVSLSAGNPTIRIYSTSNGWNFNWWEIAGSTGTTGSGSGPATSAIRIEAENYSLMNGVVKETTSDAGGGQNVGYIDINDWMDYTVNLPSAGTYPVNLRVASPNSGQQLQIRNSVGTVLASVNIPNTGGYQNWQTVTANIALNAGNQTIRIYSASNGWNFNWWEIGGGQASTPPSATTIRIEAENYANMNGVQKENTSDVGGGQNVGYIDNGDWMDYSVNVTSAGTYPIGLRIASPNADQQLLIKNSAGTVLATVAVPNTGGYQNWQTVSTTVSLLAGNQTLRIHSSSNGWNLNWWEIGSANGTITAKMVSTDAVLMPALLIYPNPVSDRFQLQINNELTGFVSVQVYDMQGSLQKQFSLTKSDAGTSQYYLSIGELAAANYVIKVTMNGWTESKSIIKQ